MGQKKIYEWSLGYAILKPYVNSTFKSYYKEVHVEGFENIPLDTPIIFAPNHQNALMEPLALLCNTPFQPVFMARADIFGSKFISKLLRFIKIMPVYRIRDGYDSLGKNEEIFNMAVEVLHHHKPLCLMPEGNHGDQHMLRPLVKGLFRIAFMAQQKSGAQPYVKIIPMGIDMTHYVNMEASLVVNFGKPIEVSEYFEEYVSNPSVAINKLRERLEVAMKKQMLHIESKEYYDSIFLLKDIYKPTMYEKLGFKKRTAFNDFRANQVLCENLNEKIRANPTHFAPLNEKVITYAKGLNTLNIRAWVLNKDKYSWLGLILFSIYMILLLPIFVVGTLVNFIPYYLPIKAVKNIKDKQFHSSVKYGIAALITFPIYYIILFVVMILTLKSLLLVFLAIVAFVLSGWMALEYFINLKKLRAKCLYNILTFKKDSSIFKMKKLRDEIKTDLTQFLNN